MSLDVDQLRAIAAKWRAARRIFPIFVGACQRFDLGIPTCPELECAIDRAEPEILARVDEWLYQADTAIEVWQLRQFLQSTQIGTEASLRTLIQWHLNKEHKTAADRDKLDFLLVQYFAQCAPASMRLRQVSLADVSIVLEPVLGETAPNTPAWLSGLDSVLNEVGACKSLRDLVSKDALAVARKLKTDSGDRYFGSGSMLAFTRYNFAVRRHVIRLIQADLEAIQIGIRELQSRGIETVDCSSAGLAGNETIEGATNACLAWRKPFREYSSGQTFEQLAALRNAIDDALAKAAQRTRAAATPARVPQPAAPKKQVLAAVASAKTASKPGPLPHGAAVAASHSSQAAPGKSTATQTATTPSAGSQPDMAAEMNAVRQLISDHLKTANVGQGKTSTQIVVRGKVILLSSWEVAAYSKADSFSCAVQRGVAARVLLSELMGNRGVGDFSRLSPGLALSHSEAAMLQELVAQARDQKDIDAAVALAATSKRLLTLIAEAEKSPKA